MQDPEVLLSQILESKLLSKIDLTKVYYQLQVNKESRPYTAFQTHNNTYEFNFLPFGLTNSPATFVKLVRKIFKNVKNVVHYIDDILVHTKKFNEPALRRVFEALKTNGLTAKPVKTKVTKTSFLFLGHIIKEGYISLDENNASKILQIKQSQTKRQVGQIIGLINYDHEFVPNYSNR